jgi:polar amino acid transport system substrate-binding protein
VHIEALPRVGSSYFLTSLRVEPSPLLLAQFDESMHNFQYMVENHRADAYIGNHVIANHMIACGLLTKIKTGISTQYKNIEYKFIAPAYWPELTFILSKGFRSLTASQHSVIKQRWYTLQTVEKQDYTLVFQVLFGAMVIFIWFYASNHRLSIAKKEVDTALEQLRVTQQALELKNIELERLSTTDKLTNIYNRVKLEAVITAELDRAHRYQEPFSVILIDLDHFKRVNDTLGHQAGDRVLRGVADLFGEHMRKVDTIGRWGREEFLVICPHCSLKEAQQFAEVLRKHIQQHDFGDIGGITASFGVTSYREGDGTVQLISRFDEALYISKESGRNKVTVNA